jgi:hypothetical protein
MALPDVVGTGVGVTADGTPSIKVFLKSGDVTGIPASIDGVPVEPQVTGEIFALNILADMLQQEADPQQVKPQPPPPGKGKGGKTPVDHRARFRPAPLGVSSAHPVVTGCTLGARLRDGPGNRFALSNNHCYAVQNAATIGDAVIQPSRIDGGTSPADDIGNLAAFQVIDFVNPVNVIDAAIASTTTALVLNSTTSDCYGTPKSTTLTAFVGLDVQKCGRTTGQSTGTVTAINATVAVNYGPPNGVAVFINQIVTTDMSRGGDSGSLLVAKTKGKNKGDNLKPVGLLYAGSAGFTTIHNPIDAVLTRFAVTVDGG